MLLPPLSSESSLNTLFHLNGFETLKLILLISTILLVGFGASTAYLIPWSLLPDAIDADPEKPAGIYTAWMVLVQKIGIGLSVQLLGVLLSLAGYKSLNNCGTYLDCLEQPSSAQITIRVCMGLIPAVLVAIGLIVMRRWPDRGAHLQTAN